MHFLGLAGMPRRIPNILMLLLHGMLLHLLGSYFSTFSAIFFFYVVYVTLARGRSFKNTVYKIN